MTRLASVTVVSVVNDAIVTPDRMARFIETIASEATDFDLVLVANAVASPVALALKTLVARTPDVTAVFLGEIVHDDVARLVGIEHAVGDYVLFWDLRRDDPAWLPPLLAPLGRGHDLVVGDLPLAAPERPRRAQFLVEAYMRLYAAMTGVRLEHRPTGVRVFSREAALFVAGRPNAELLLRARDIGSGFPSASVALPPGAPAERAAPRRSHSWSGSVGMLLSVSTLPLRGATYAALLGGALSVPYSLYVFLIYLLKPDVAPGWTTISLQLGAMMFIFSLVLLFISEYVMQIHSASPPRSRRYLVLREVRSPLSRRSTRLNIVDEAGRFQLGQPDWLPTLDRGEDEAWEKPD